MAKLWVGVFVSAIVVVLYHPTALTMAYVCCVLGGLALALALASGVAGRRDASGTNLRNKVLLLGFSVCLAIGLGEATLRIFFSFAFAQPANDLRLPYEYHEELGWFPKKNTTQQFTGSRTIKVTQNSEGFRGPEWEVNDKPGIMILGDSFVWGFDVETAERFTEKLQARHPEWNVYNLGVCGYGTDQELLLLRIYFEQLKPRAVILIVCTENDGEDCSTNIRLGGYYKPYFTLTATNLTLNGLPVPRSERAIRSDHPWLCASYLSRLMVRVYCKARNPPLVQVPNLVGPLVWAMRQYTVDQGAFFGVGLQGTAPETVKFMERSQISYVELTTTNRYPSQGCHWTPKGHDDVCESLDRFLTTAVPKGWLKH